MKYDTKGRLIVTREIIVSQEPVLEDGVLSVTSPKIEYSEYTVIDETDMEMKYKGRFRPDIKKALVAGVVTEEDFNTLVTVLRKLNDADTNEAYLQAIQPEDEEEI